MPAEKLTPWIDWPTKPVRVGWYDVRVRIAGVWLKTRLRWNGRRFVDVQGRNNPLMPLMPGDQWRGLAEKPKEQGNAG